MQCRSCGAQTAGRFCQNCGKALDGRGQITISVPWAITGAAAIGLVVLILVMLVSREKAVASISATPPASLGADQGAPPDISNMTPRERFDRLYNRVMAAAESGDQATVNQFTPMAIQAYSMLDRADADARFHLALLSLHTGDPGLVEALADTILQDTPGHLFAYMIRGTRARFANDQVALKQAYTDFLGHYDEEMAKKRPEYADHTRSVEDFKKAAQTP